MHVHVNVHFNAHYIVLKEVKNPLKTINIYFWIVKPCVEIDLRMSELVTRLLSIYRLE